MEEESRSSQLICWSVGWEIQILLQFSLTAKLSIVTLTEPVHSRSMIVLTLWAESRNLSSTFRDWGKERAFASTIRLQPAVQ